MRFQIITDPNDPRTGIEALRSVVTFTGPEIYTISKVAEYALATLEHYGSGSSPEVHTLVELAHIPSHANVSELNPKTHTSPDWQGNRIRGFIEFFLTRQRTDLGLLLLSSTEGRYFNGGDHNHDDVIDSMSPDFLDPYFDLRYNIHSAKELLVVYDLEKQRGIDKFAAECAQNGLGRVLEALRIK